MSERTLTWKSELLAREKGAAAGDECHESLAHRLGVATSEAHSGIRCKKCNKKKTVQIVVRSN